MDASIIITAYNYEQYIAEAIDSCLQQACDASFEVIVIDDGSTDKTTDIARTYKKSIRLISQKNSGIEKASNVGFSSARGHYIVRVDADDALYPEYLQTLLDEFTCDLAFVYPEYDVIDANSSILTTVSLPDFDPAEIRSRGDFLATGTLFEKSRLEAASFYNESVKNCGLENFELMLKMLNAGFRGKCIHSPLFKYRRHGNNISDKRRSAIINYGKQLANHYNLGTYTTNQYHPYGLTL